MTSNAVPGTVQIVLPGPLPGRLDNCPILNVALSNGVGTCPGVQVLAETVR